MANPRFTFTHEVSPVCEIGLSEVRLAEPTTWFDVSCFVHQAEVFRGRERFNDRFEPGTASVTFANDDGWADLGGTYAEVAAADLRPGRQIRIGVNGPWNPGMAPFTRWLYRGFIDQATPAYDPVLHDVVTVNCVDALGESGSSIAPAGELVGVNETVSARINRVLDAVGWWGSKRKIDASPTIVQGTRLGSSGIDHLGQAADSAGGVVFGDLDGDVVFRDIDWMLYDPDMPPDGTVGPGDPGAPPGDTPPYIDPEPGAVFDPDDPPANTPPKVCVCADGTAGTLVEKGDSYRLYVKGGHLFYESSGTTWDMGPYSGGCNCVDPHGGGGGTTPTRTDPNDPGYIPPAPIELPPEFGVELLAWNDGGLSDPPAAAVTVGGIHPGHDCLLVVLVNALGTATNTAPLAPVIAGGGLDWAHRRDMDHAGDGADSFIFVAPVGRTDPGTFSVVVTWTAPMTSRSHIVTVWKVTAQANDYLSRFDAGLVLYGVTGTTSDGTEPGNGLQFVKLRADRQPNDVYMPTRLVDITLAQSLAEEGTPPFGAILLESNDWVIPDKEPALPAVILLDAPWSDDFERADGPLGTNWVTGPGSGFDDDIHPFAISSGAAVPTATDTDPGSGLSTANMMRWATALAADQQVIEIEVDNCWPNGYAQLFTNLGTGQQSQFADFQFNEDAGPQIIVSVFHFDSSGTNSSSVASATISHSGATPVRLRLESAPDGTQNVYIDDALAASGVDPSPVVGTRVGMGLQPTNAFVDNTKILRAAGGSLARVRKTSWVAGWRVGHTTDNVDVSDVNTGPSDIQSGQACLVIESAEPEQGWRIIGRDLRARPSGVTEAGTFTFNQAPRPGALVVVFVGLTASADLVDSVAVTGADFTRSTVAHKTGSSWGQGAVYAAVAPLDMDPSSWAITVTYPGCESVSAVVYEVTVQSDTAPIGGTAAGVLGTHTAGSVDGAHTVTLSAVDAAAGTLAYIHVAADPSTSSGVDHDEGEWFTEYQSESSERGYFQTMSRQSGTTSTAVTWTDVQTGTTAASSGVELAVQVVPYDGLPATGAGSGVYLGGVTDPWNGTITSAEAFDPVTTLPIWSFP